MGKGRVRPASPTNLSYWSSELTSSINLRTFRGHGPYLWQLGVTANTLSRSFDALPSQSQVYASLLDEDGTFGAVCHQVGSAILSRDLLDSASELAYLAEMAPTSNARAVDIGAGYGRLAHRASALLPAIEWLCVDAVDASTKVCRFYLDHRRCTGVEVASAASAQRAVAQFSAELAVAAHSLPEMPLSAVIGWLTLLRESGCEFLYVVADLDKGLTSWEMDWSRVDLLPVIESVGFELVDSRPKYLSTEQGLLYPDIYYLFKGQS